VHPLGPEGEWQCIPWDLKGVGVHPLGPEGE